MLYECSIDALILLDQKLNNLILLRFVGKYPG
jgi:hypothetical protein